MVYALPDLPYDYNALDPHISARTLEFHHDKHHAAYVTKCNEMTQDTPMADMAIAEIIKSAYGDSAKAGLFNNAAQAWNHTFYWNSMKPGGGGLPSGALAAKINTDFGNYDNFKAAFKEAGATQFGSGWAWLVLDNGTLKVTKTPNAENPLVHGQTPLLTMDVWEHAYYLDFQNKRPDYIDTFLSSLVNWDFAAQQLSAT
ncbi:MAG: superoxide dismutase [Acaryochloris sp. CRU_2_0]|nr:superoxide dismutase [Acaryochloris sp. CRU_2_0]